MEDLDEAIKVAFAQVDVGVALPDEVFQTPNPSVDLIVDPEGAALEMWVKRAAVVNDQMATHLVLENERRGALAADRRSPVLFVVADQVTRTARRVLTQAGAGYLDRRGHLGVHAPGLIVEVDIEPQIRQVGRRDPLSGNVGLEVAAALLLAPNRGPAVRQLSRELNRSVSTVSDVLSGLREGRYIDDRNTVSGTSLFWALAERWPGDGDYLIEAPRPTDHGPLMEQLRFGFERVGEAPGWALRGSAAASVLGAPVAVRADQPLDFFVPDATIAHRARRLLGAAPSADLARCSVAVAPVPAVCMARIDPPGNYFEWPTTHLLFVALDLAQDAGRGHEVLRDWTPSGAWSRVW